MEISRRDLLPNANANFVRVCASRVAFGGKTARKIALGLCYLIGKLRMSVGIRYDFAVGHIKPQRFFCPSSNL